MLVPFLGYVVAATALTTVAVLLTGLVNTATIEKRRHHPTPVIAPKVKVEIQRHLPAAKKASPAKDASPVAKEASPAKDASPIVSTAKADTKKASITKPKCLPVSTTTTAMGRRRVMRKNLGTAQEASGSADPAHGWPAASRRPGPSRNDPRCFCCTRP